MGRVKQSFSAAVMLMRVAAAGYMDTHRVIRPPDWTSPAITMTDSIYIAVSEDGRYGRHAYPGCGVTTTRTAGSAIARRARSATTARAPQSLDAGLDDSAVGGYRHLTYATILHWEDRGTEWSGIPEQVEVRIDVVDVRARTIVGTATIEGTSGLATLGGDRPKDLLAESTDEFVASLY